MTPQRIAEISIAAVLFVACRTCGRPMALDVALDCVTCSAPPCDCVPKQADAPVLREVQP